uniref:Glypican n=1 Tax=Clastoptera arizonana TaxID=38151 RepID=A0A1B6DS00_9HEMI
MEKLLNFVLVSVWCSLVSSADLHHSLQSRFNLVENNISNCSSVKPIFEPKNITTFVPDKPIDGSPLLVCRSRESCCTQDMESNLKRLVRKDFQSLLHHSSQTVQGLLATTAATLQEHVTSLAQQSENKTLTLFHEAYKRMFTLATEPILNFYSSLLTYLSRASTGVHTPSNIPSDDATVLERIVSRFFAQLFPLVYHHAVNYHSTDFTPEYKNCLREASPEILPFGDIPRDIALDVAKSFQETKVLLEALLLGADVLNTTDQLMSSGSQSTSLDNCYEALLRLYYCPRCQGLPSTIKPCNGYCLNVMRGCLTQQRANDLDLPWNNFLIETERLVKQTQSGQEHNGIEEVLRTLTSRISDGVMFASMHGPLIEKKVKKFCGNSKLTPGEPPGNLPEDERLEPGVSVVLPGVTVISSSVAPRHKDRSQASDSPLVNQLSLFLDTIAATQARGFYANLAEALCSDENFAETRDTAECWNGQRVGEYTKTLVRPGVDAQKYNPELSWTETDPDPKIRQLSDKLRHMRQLVLSQLSQTNTLVSESYVRNEGSGSGLQPSFVDDDDDDGSRDPDDLDQGSGSGAIPNDIDQKINPSITSSNSNGKTLSETTGAASSHYTPLVLVTIAAVTATIRCLTLH